MKPVELEIIMRDSTRQGMQSVTGNVEELSKRIAQQNALIQKLEGDLRSMQAAFKKASRSGDQTENIAMIAALRKEVSTLKGELSELEKAQKKTSSAPVVSPVAPSGLKEQIAEVKANIKYMEDYVKQYEKSMKGMAPGKEKAIMTQEVEGAKAALLGEKEALVQLEAQMGSAGQKQTMLRTQIMNLKQEMAGMTEGTEEYRAAMERLGQMQDQYGDISAQGRIFADDEKGIKATMDAVSGLSGVMAVGVGAASLFGMEEEKLAQIQTKLQAVMAITMGVQQVANTLNKDSYFTHIILGRAKRALTAANELDTASQSRGIIVTKLATVVQWAHNKAVMANPYVAAALAVVAVVAAIGALIYAFSRWSAGARDAEREQRRLTLEIERTKSAINQISEDVDFDVRIAEAAGASKAELLSLRKEAAKTALSLADLNFDNVNNKFMSGKAKKEQLDEARNIAQEAWDSYNKVMQDAVVYDIEKRNEKKKTKTSDSKESLTTKVADAELKARQKIEAMKLAIMAEGAAKEKAEARARFDAELARIEQEERERLEALKKAKKNGLPVSKEQVTAVTDQSGQQRKLASQVYVKEFFDVEKEYADKQKKDFDKLLEKYQDYTAQRVDIEKKYSADIAKLQAERDAAQQKGDAEKVDQMNRAIAQATTSKGKDLMGLDYEQLKQTPDYVRAFENLKETSSDTLDSLLSQLENAKSAAAEVLSPDQLREYTTTIQEIMDELDSRNPFGALADRKKELAEAEAELATAQQQLNAVQGGAQVVTGVKNTKLNDKTGKIESEKTYLTTTKAMDNYNKAQDNVTKKGAKVKKAEKDVKDVMDDLFNSIKDVGDAIGGPAGEIIGMIGDIGLFTMTAMSGVQTASKTATTAIEQVEKASAILAIIGAAIQIAMKIASLFKEDDGVAAYEKSKDVYESYIDILDRVIEKQKELFELNSKTGEQAYEKAKDTIKLQEDASRDLGKQYLNSGASGGFLGIGSSASKGKNQRKGISDSGWGQWDAFAGSIGIDPNDIGDRMTGLFDLSAKQLADLQEKAPLFWAELHDDTRTYLEQIIACSDELKQIEADRKEGLTNIDFESFYSGFIDTLSDMDASSEDFANSFEDYLKNAILSSLITNEYKTRIQALYDNWSSYTKSGAKLTEEEVEALRKEQQDISDEMLRKREELAKTFGWQSEAEKEQQAGKAGAFTTMTQDQGSELKGLFTSVQGHVSDIDDLLKDIAMAMYEAFDTLPRIEANTAYCKHLEQMAEDIAELKRDGFKMK